MNDEDKKLLELYLHESKKKKIIILSIIILFLLFFVILSGKYYYKNLFITDNSSITVQEKNINSLNEVIENNVANNTNSKIVSENTNENSTQKQENTAITNTQEKPLQEGKPKEETKRNSNKNTTSKTNIKKEEHTSTRPQNRDFLFADGYTMENVTQAAQEYLKSNGYAGECIPLRDNEGVYLGMRVIFH